MTLMAMVDRPDDNQAVRARRVRHRNPAERPPTINIVAPLDRVTQPWLHVVQGFADALAEETGPLDELTDAAATALGVQAATALLNGQRWANIVGERWDTTTVAELLGVSRQALAKRQRTHSILGLRGVTTTWYPTWQFDRERHEVRDVVRPILGAFYDADEDTDALVIASWAQTRQFEDLVSGGTTWTPAAWITAGNGDDAVVACARRTAARLAQ